MSVLELHNMHKREGVNKHFAITYLKKMDLPEIIPKNPFSLITNMSDFYLHERFASFSPFTQYIEGLNSGLWEPHPLQPEHVPEHPSEPFSTMRFTYPNCSYLSNLANISPIDILSCSESSCMVICSEFVIIDSKSSITLYPDQKNNTPI